MPGREAVVPGDVVQIAAISVLRMPSCNATKIGDYRKSFDDASSVLGPPTEYPHVWIACWSSAFAWCTC